MKRWWRKLRGEPVAIYGAGSTGALLAAALRSERRPRIRPVAFVDDDPGRTLGRIAGLPVYPSQHLDRACARLGFARVIVSLPSVEEVQRRRIIDRLNRLGLRVETVPGIDELLAGRRALTDLRAAEAVSGVEALGSADLLREHVGGARIAVTGAGCSIGSELARQIARLRPERLVLIERSEHNLFRIHEQLRSEAAREGRGIQVRPCLADAGNRVLMGRLFAEERIDIVYHAAAYKHLPLVEANPLEGVVNNVLVTTRCASAAQDAGVGRFVLVSTDKAVRPTSVMGASKRLAELVVQAFAQRGSATRFAVVRFANVLDSSGSVLPVFREQIRHGGPATVTHPRARRYFTTIPEAAGLLLQAGALVEGGEVFVLEPDEAVRIEDLARRLIALSGLRVRDEAQPDGEIPIVYTGLRPGEKLEEQLLLGKQVSGTGYRRILRAWEPARPWSELAFGIEELQRAELHLDAKAARSLLSRLVPEYQEVAPPEGGSMQKVRLLRTASKQGA